MDGGQSLRFAFGGSDISSAGANGSFQSEGIEFSKTLESGLTEFHSVKRQKVGIAWSLSDLTRQRPNGRSVLGDLFSKLAVNSRTRVVFVSQTGANELLELCERARHCAAPEELDSHLKMCKALAEDFERCILPLCDRKDLALDRLKRLRAVPFEQEELLRRVAQKTLQWIYRPDGQEVKPDGVRLLLGEFILNRLGQVIRKADDRAPALGIVAHTRKPRFDERTTGRALLNVLAGSYFIASVPRTVFVMQAASDDTQDKRIVWTCCKNNDGELGGRSAWERRNGLFVPVPDFDWKSFEDDGEKRKMITLENLDALFEGGERRLARKAAVKELMELTSLEKTACYLALKPDGKFRNNLSEQDGLLQFRP